MILIWRLLLSKHWSPLPSNMLQSPLHRILVSTQKLAHRTALWFLFSFFISPLIFKERNPWHVPFLRAEMSQNGTWNNFGQLLLVLISLSPLPSQLWEHKSDCDGDLIEWQRAEKQVDEIILPNEVTRTLLLDDRPWKACSIFFFFLLIFLNLGPHLWHMLLSGSGVKLELQQLAYATARAMPDLSCIYDLHHSLWQYSILIPLSEARDWTHIFVDVSWVLKSLSLSGNSGMKHFKRHFGEFPSWRSG